MEEHPNIFDSSYAPSTKKSKKKPRDPDRAARPPNSWILYRAQKSKEISDQQKQREKDGTAGDRLRQTDVSRIISLAWQTESEEVKEKFAEMARKHKAEHKIMYPDYQYRPRTPRTPASESDISTLRSSRISDGLKSQADRQASDASTSPESIASSSYGTSTGNGVPYGGFPARSPDLAPQRQPRASTDLSPRQLSSPFFKPIEHPNRTREPSSFSLSSSSMDPTTFRSQDSIRRETGEDDGAPLRPSGINPSAFLPPSYRSSGLQPLSPQSPTREVAPQVGPSSAFVSSDHPYHRGSSSTSSFSQFQAPHSAPVSSNALESYSSSFPLSSAYSLAQGGYEPNHGRWNRQSLNDFQALDQGFFPDISYLESASRPHFKDRPHQSSDSDYSQHTDDGWNRAMDTASQQLSGTSAQWNQFPSMQSTLYTSEDEKIDRYSSGSQWKGKGREREATVEQLVTGYQSQQPPPPIREGTQSHDQDQGWKFKPALDPRRSSKELFDSSFDTLSPSSASTSSSSASQFSQPHEAHGYHPSGSRYQFMTQVDQESSLPSSGLSLDLGSPPVENEIELHGTFTPSQLLDKIFELNRSKSTDREENER